MQRGTGNVSGRKSGAMNTGEGRGVHIEDTEKFLATEDWVSVLGME